MVHSRGRGITWECSHKAHMKGDQKAHGGDQKAHKKGPLGPYAKLSVPFTIK